MADRRAFVVGSPRCHWRESTLRRRRPPAPCVGPDEERIADVQSGLNSGVGSRAVLIRLRKSLSATDRTPSAPRSARPKHRRATDWSALQLAGQLVIVHRPSWTAPATTARTSLRLVSCQAVSPPRGGQDEAHRPAGGAPSWHPSRAVQPGEAGVAALPSGWDQHVNHVEVRCAPDGVVHQGHRTGNEAARPA